VRRHVGIHDRALAAVIVGQDDRQGLRPIMMRCPHDPLIIHRVAAVHIQQTHLFVNGSVHKRRGLDDGGPHPQQILHIVSPSLFDGFEAAVVLQNFLPPAKHKDVRILFDRLFESHQRVRSQLIIGVQPDDPLTRRAQNALVDRVGQPFVFF